jgi:pyruvate-ferredoxin/flavodoxin oxidoreductase
VLDRTKEPGSHGEPLFLDVLAALSEATPTGSRSMPRVIGGRYGLSSKEFTPAMVAGVFEELAASGRGGGSRSGSTTTSPARASPTTRRSTSSRRDRARGVLRPRLRRDGRREQEHDQDPRRRGGLHAQGYFVYDSKKSGSQTVSHLRFGPQPIRAPYLISAGELRRLPPVRPARARRGARAGGAGRDAAAQLPAAPGPVWDALARPVQEQILAKQIKLYVIDAARIARDAGLAGRTNTVLQTCFFAISGVLEREEAIERIKASIAKTYGKRGAEVVARNQTAVDTRWPGCAPVELPEQVTATREPAPLVPATRRSSCAP